MTTDPALPAPAHGEDVDDAAVRHEQRVKKAVRHAVRRLRRLDAGHGGGSVALANMGSRGVRIVFVATDGTFGDVIVPTAAAAEQVCLDGGWEITGWDPATVGRIAPSEADRRRMAGTGR